RQNERAVWKIRSGQRTKTAVVHEDQRVNRRGIAATDRADVMVHGVRGPAGHGKQRDEHPYQGQTFHICAFTSCQGQLANFSVCVTQNSWPLFPKTELLKLLNRNVSAL